MNERCPDCDNEMAYVTETEGGFMVANYSECERCGYTEKEEEQP